MVISVCKAGSVAERGRPKAELLLSDMERSTLVRSSRRKSAQTPALRCEPTTTCATGVTSLFAALDMASGKVTGAIHRRHRAAEDRKFLIRIDKGRPTDLDVHTICDNYATHKTDLIQRWLAAHPHPRFHVHFIRTSSSRRNMDQRWLGELTTKLIQHPTRHSQERPSLEADIRTWNEPGTRTHTRTYGPRPPTRSSTASSDLPMRLPVVGPRPRTDFQTSRPES